MANMNCDSIKSSLVDYLQAQVEVITFKSRCVVTLPIKTVDDRYIDVAVEQKFDDFFIVHDEGKTIAELFSQGITLTDTKKSRLLVMAKKFGVGMDNDIFTVGCKADGIQNAILAISQCSSIAMFELFSHQPTFEDEPLSSRVARSLKEWQPPFISSIDRRVALKGRKYPHTYDFVAHAVQNGEQNHRTAAIKLLPPTYGGKVQAERYAFMVFDLERTPYDSWSRLAVLTKVETWPLPSIQMVRDLSRETLEVRTNEEPLIPELLPGKMNAVVAA